MTLQPASEARSAAGLSDPIHGTIADDVPQITLIQNTTSAVSESVQPDATPIGAGPEDPSA